MKKLIRYQNKREDISDMIKSEAYDDPEFKKGLVLKFERTTIKITRIDRKNKRAWGEHIQLHDQRITLSHYGHEVDLTENTPFCIDCEVPVSESSTEDGDKKFLDRKDNTLEDGTFIG